MSNDNNRIVSTRWIRMWVVICLAFNVGVLEAIHESYVFFDRTISYWNWLPTVVDPLDFQPKSLSLKTSNVSWNSHFMDATKRLTKYKSGEEPGLIDGTFVRYIRYYERDIQIPSIVYIDWYYERALDNNFTREFRKEIKKTLTKKVNANTGRGKSLDLVNTEFAGTNVALKINGNITIDGQLIFQQKDQIQLNMKDNKSWDLDIEQTQKFNIEGTIGDRWLIEVEQDSEADFAWENNMFLKYKGKKNDIFQSMEAGNISLNLPSTQFVSVGSGKNEGLFGIKMEHQLGSLTMKTILSREQVKKSAKTLSGGMSSDGMTINDYSFIKDRYFFIDEKFKNQYYPLNDQSMHTYDPYHVIGEYQVFKRVFAIEEGVVPGGVAFEDPSLGEESHYETGSWKRLTQGIDYVINPLLGYIRLNTVSSNEAVGIGYTLSLYNPETQEFIPVDSNENPLYATYTDVDYAFDSCLDEGWTTDSTNCEEWVEGNDTLGYQIQGEMRLKLIKEGSSTTPNSHTWDLMFKNVYSLGGGNINPTGLEIELLHNEGGGLEKSHSEISGRSYMNIFGLDNVDANNQIIDGGDGKIDLYGSIINLTYGELFLPTHLPFAYDTIPRQNPIGDTWNQFGISEEDTSYTGHHYWGIHEEDLINLLNEPLNDPDGDFDDDPDTGPAMYFSTNQSDITAEHEFIMKVKSSSSGGSMSLGFTIVKGSETVTLNGQVLQNGVDYTVDYYSGTLNFLTPEATDPTANIQVTYEENEFISFDQKLLAGTHLKYEFDDKNFISGGAFYYNQSIADKKVDIGYEPMQNFIWNINGRYNQELEFLTKAVDKLPFLETTKPSRFKFEGEYAEVYPNPNPLGEAFLDDFEGSKRTTSPSIMQRQWNMSSPPCAENEIGSFCGDPLSVYPISDRVSLAWFNPYYDVNTEEIWPQQETSTQANNTTTKTLWLETNIENLNPISNDMSWNGVTTLLYPSDFDQTRSKYLDIWLNADDVNDNNLTLHIDIGHISEDIDADGILDTEDEDIYGGGMGDNILDDEEDTGLDGCFDEYETGNPYDPCSIEVNPNYVEGTDPNGDNWNYEEGTGDYSQMNGLEGNGQAMGYRYPDTEDIDKDYNLDISNSYFSIELSPALDEDQYFITETIRDNGTVTGWKLFRMPLTTFEKRGDTFVEWNDVRTIRLWIESEALNVNNTLKIAKLEMVGNEWEEVGNNQIDSLYVIDFTPESTFSIEVINTDENPEYEMPPGAAQEEDAYSGIKLREQSLVLSFMCNETVNQDCINGGIPDSYFIMIQKNFTALPTDKQNSFFAYKNMEMFIHGGDPNPDNIEDYWISNNITDSSDVELIFRMGKDENYYEIRQPIYKGWDERNHVNFNLDTLSSRKLQIHPLEGFEDTGIDSVYNEYENGCGGALLDGLTYTAVLDSLGIDVFFNTNEYQGTTICGSLNWDDNCTTCDISDPNGDDYDCGTDLLCPGDEGYEFADVDSTENIEGSEGNNLYDLGEFITDDDGNGNFDDPADEEIYQDEADLWLWEGENYGISHVCGNCTELRIKGEPSVNNIEYIKVGVINKTTDTIFGKVLLDELRMTGVKRDKGRAFRVEASIDFADFMSISTSYVKKEADFHLLQQRLGSGNNEESFFISANMNPNLFLPVKWGVKTPLKVTYTNSVLSPKFHPGSDIPAGDINDPGIIDIQTRTEKVTFNTSFSKSARSKNWFVKSTLDNLTMNFSAIGNRKSTTTIKNEESLDLHASSRYSYSFGKENYINPLKWMSGFPVLGEFLSESRLYYTPDKFSAEIALSELDKLSTQRVGTVTPTYSLNMERDMALKYKFTKSTQANYSIGISSNLDEYKDNKIDFIKDMDTGVIKAVREKFTNTFSPEFLNWLDPKVTYNPSYNWDLTTQLDTLSLAKISVTAPLKTSVNISPKEFIELFYTPESKSGSSSSGRGRRGRSSSTSSKNTKIHEFKNPVMKYLLGKLHKIFSKVSKFKVNIDHTETHTYNNILASDSPDYAYRLGLQSMPDILNYDNEAGNYSFTNKIDDVQSISTSLNITNKFQISKIEYKHTSSRNISSTSSPQLTLNTTETYLPLGMRGDEGFPFVTWNVNWSGFEKMWFFDKYFKSVSLSHSFSGNRSDVWKADDLESWDYTQSFSPLLGMTMKTKGKNYSSFNLTFSKSLSISNRNIGTPTTRTYNDQFNISFSHKRSSGLNIPLFFFRDFYISNDMNFDLSFNWSQNYKLVNPGNAQSLEDFNEDERSMTLSIKPNVTYSFTRWVNGNFYFVYSVSENKTSGKNEERDFGFKVNIKIQG